MFLSNGYDVQSYKDVAKCKTPHTPSRLIEFSKPRFFLLLHGLLFGFYCLYQCLWFFSEKVTAFCYIYRDDGRPSQTGSTLVYQYQAGDYLYTETTTRNGLSDAEQYIEVQYLRFAPGYSRPTSFESQWMGFLIAWSIFFVTTAMIFFIPNETMPRHSYFSFTSKKPFIQMVVK